MALASQVFHLCKIKVNFISSCLYILKIDVLRYSLVNKLPNLLITTSKKTLQFKYFKFLFNYRIFCLYRILFASSVLNLTELVGLRPDLAPLKKIIYFHENQLTYPVQNKTTRNKNTIENKEQRDFQYGYNQILTRLISSFKKL